MATIAAYDDVVTVPRLALRFPLEIPVPPGFDPALPQSWPPVQGRIEFVEGRLLFMPPCGGDQQQTAHDLSIELGDWRRSHPQFVVGSNEAGMLLSGQVRAADAAVWLRSTLGASSGGFPRVPPVLAAEVAGQDEQPAKLAEKAAWYLAEGVQVVWILTPATRSVRVITAVSDAEHGPGSVLPAHPSLPDLCPRVDDLFRQIAGG